MKKKFPNLFIPGAPKSGTTYLYAVLQAHPEIYFPKIKELNHFSYDELIQHSYYKEYKVEKRDKFLGFFKTSSNYKYMADGSVSYFAYHSVAKKIKDFNPEAKLIFTLRNPIKRAFSHYQMDCRMGHVKREFYDCIREEKSNPYYTQYVQNSLYYENISIYLEHFDKSNMHIVFLERMDEELEGIMNFLDVDKNALSNETNEAVNPNKSPKNFIARFIQKNRKIATILKPLIPKGIIRFSNKLLYGPPVKQEIDDKSEQYLYTLFRNDIEKLSAFLQLDLHKIWDLEKFKKQYQSMDSVS